MQGVIINGVATEYLPVMDRGLHYGDGIFETIACIDNRLQFWQPHMARMSAAADKLGLAFPGGHNYLDDVKQLLADKPAAQDCVIKLMLTRGVTERGYRYPSDKKVTRIAMLSSLPADIQQIQKQGARVTLCQTPVSVNSQLAGIKHLCRIDNVLARNEWQDEYNEGLMMDDQRHIIEGTMSNLLAVRDGVIYTPSLENSGVAGIVRQQIINIAIERGIAVKQTNLLTDDLLAMDELMLSNSLIAIWPVTEFAGKHYSIGKLTSMMIETLRERAIQDAEYAA